LVLLPLVTILVVPALPQRPAWGLPPAFALAAPAVIALLALACVLVAHGLGRLLGWLPGDAPAAAAPAASAATPGTLRPSASVRLSLQLVVSLAVAFAVGLVAFRDHWRWLVLTALLVSIGGAGQFDVLRRGVLRVLGAAGGTVLAMAVAGLAGGDAPTVGALVMACVFAGLVLRVFGYGWWVLCVTLALALLQTLEPAAEPLLLWRRLLEIVIGAAIAIAAASFVFPIPSADILRRRIAGALAAMSEALDPDAAERRPQAVVGAMALVRQMQPVFRAQGVAHRLARRRAPPRPTLWIDTLLACEAPLLGLVERGEAPGAVRKAIGTARKALREPDEIGAALAALRGTLETAGPPSP
ncbi:MAG: FUSC family protein, partial [Vitreoscilla sp.]